MNFFKIGRKLTLNNIEKSCKKAFEQGRLIFKDDIDGFLASVEYTDNSGSKTVGTMAQVAEVIHTNVSLYLVEKASDVRASLDSMEVTISDVEKILAKIMLEKIKGDK